MPLKIAAAFPDPPFTDAAAAEPAVLRSKQMIFRHLASSATGPRGPGSEPSGAGDSGASASVEVLLTFGDPVPAAALAAARVCCLTTAETSACGDSSAALQGTKLSPRNEDAALRRVRLPGGETHAHICLRSVVSLADTTSLSPPGSFTICFRGGRAPSCGEGPPQSTALAWPPRETRTV